MALAGVAGLLLAAAAPGDLPPPDAHPDRSGTAAQAPAVSTVPKSGVVHPPVSIDRGMEKTPPDAAHFPTPVIRPQAPPPR